MPITWRLADLDDIPLLASLNHQLIQDEGHRNPMTIPELADRMSDWLRSGEYRGVLLADGETTVGYCLYGESEREIHLRHFFVCRDRRRQGIGQAALKILLSELWPQDKRLSVSVLVRNERGAAFWRAAGFTDYDLTLELPRDAPPVR